MHCLFSLLGHLCKDECAGHSQRCNPTDGGGGGGSFTQMCSTTTGESIYSLLQALPSAQPL